MGVSHAQFEGGLSQLKNASDADRQRWRSDPQLEPCPRRSLVDDEVSGKPLSALGAKSGGSVVVLRASSSCWKPGTNVSVRDLARR